VTQRIRAVVFDLDGLIFNTEDLYQHVGSVVLRRRGKNFDDDLLDRMMGRHPKIALQMMIDYHDLNGSVEQLALESEEVFREILDERLKLMPGFADLMQSLEQATILSSGISLQVSATLLACQPRPMMPILTRSLGGGPSRPKTRAGTKHAAEAIAVFNRSRRDTLFLLIVRLLIVGIRYVVFLT